MSGSYEIRYLPVAARDVEGVASYISTELNNPSAAKRIVRGIVAGVATLATMPYRRPLYQAQGPLEHEYRMLKVEGYLVFYWVSEEPDRTVTVARVLYGRSDIEARLAKADELT